MEKGVYFPKKMGSDKGMILNLLNTDKLGSFIRSDIPGEYCYSINMANAKSL